MRPYVLRRALHPADGSGITYGSKEMDLALGPNPGENLLGP